MNQIDVFTLREMMRDDHAGSHPVKIGFTKMAANHVSSAYLQMLQSRFDDGEFTGTRSIYILHADDLPTIHETIGNELEPFQLGRGEINGNRHLLAVPDSDYAHTTHFCVYLYYLIDENKYAVILEREDDPVFTA